jgi:aminoglycoside phosphotransferase (APT) family kinase protein
VIDEIRRLLTRRLPGYEVGPISGLGEGLDNAAYEVNGELIFRASKEPDPAVQADATRREAALLAVMAEFSTLPIPEPVFADAEGGVLAYRMLPGLPLMDHPVAKPTRLASALGEFLTGLHRTPLEEIEHLVERDTYPLSAWLQDAERDYREIAERMPAAARRPVEDFLGRPPPADNRAAALCHNDLRAEHMLVDVGTSAITGTIDWTDAAISDPARDLAFVYRDLRPEAFELTPDHYGDPFSGADRERAAFYARCKLLEDMVYGLRAVGARRYAEVGLAHLARIFGDLA